MSRNKSTVQPVGFWRGAGIPKGPRVNTFIECGCCGAYHRTDFYGDCREDSERYGDLPAGAVLVYEDDEEDDDGERTGCACCGESWQRGDSDASDPDTYCCAECERGELAEGEEE